MSVKRSRGSAVGTIVEDGKIRYIFGKIQKIIEIRYYHLWRMLLMCDGEMFRENRIRVYQYLKIAYFYVSLLFWA